MFMSNSYLVDPPDDVTFGKWPFEKMSGGLEKNSEPLPRSWDLEEFRASLWVSINLSYILWAHSYLEKF